MNDATPAQDTFLDDLCEKKTPVAIFLISGIKLQGIITSYDRYGFVLEDAQQNSQLVLKHMISTVSPAQAGVHDGAPRFERRSSPHHRSDRSDHRSGQHRSDYRSSGPRSQNPNDSGEPQPGTERRPTTTISVRNRRRTY